MHHAGSARCADYDDDARSRRDRKRRLDSQAASPLSAQVVEDLRQSVAECCREIIEEKRNAALAHASPPPLTSPSGPLTSPPPKPPPALKLSESRESGRGRESFRSGRESISPVSADDYADEDPFDVKFGEIGEDDEEKPPFERAVKMLTDACENGLGPGVVRARTPSAPLLCISSLNIHRCSLTLPALAQFY